MDIIHGRLSLLADMTPSIIGKIIFYKYIREGIHKKPSQRARSLKNVDEFHRNI